MKPIKTEVIEQDIICALLCSMAMGIGISTQIDLILDEKSLMNAILIILNSIGLLLSTKLLIVSKYNIEHQLKDLSKITEGIYDSTNREAEE